jgi:hypothetical protein
MRWQDGILHMQVCVLPMEYSQRNYLLSRAPEKVLDLDSVVTTELVSVLRVIQYYRFPFSQSIY